jgi:teichuronic acid biosynthesis glycosyltransferase TuaH
MRCARSWARSWSLPVSASLGGGAKGPLGGDIVVCSLEAWDEIWRRNQFLVSELMRRDPTLQVLFVEPPVDVPYELAHRRHHGATGLRQVTDDKRLWALRPRKLLPRVLAPGLADLHLARTVKTTAARLGLRQPLLWVNDATYAALADVVAWPVVYDVTDDWLLAEGTGRALQRLRLADARLLERSEEVVGVSSSLITSRGKNRQVHQIGCAVDVAHFSSPRPRPSDLPPSPLALYVGTQQDERLDVALCEATARAITPATLVFVGPNCLPHQSASRLVHAGCLFLGPRPYQSVPAYYQHADVVVVPHLVSPFTESLDPIKGYECLAVGRPALSTPVAGMRELGPPVDIAAAEDFPARAKELLAEQRPTSPGHPPTWADRADAFAAVLDSARAKRAQRQVA